MINPTNAVTRSKVKSIFSLLNRSRTRKTGVIGQNAIAEPPANRCIGLKSGSAPRIMSIGHHRQKSATGISHAVLRFRLPKVSMLLPRQASLIQSRATKSIITTLTVTMLKPYLSVTATFCTMAYSNLPHKT